MSDVSSDFCGRCRATIYPFMTNCPNCGAWRESATSGEPVTEP